MGNNTSSRHPYGGSTATGKVILWNGTVYEFEKPVTVAELMLEHPQQVVVEFQANSANTKRPNPLPADKRLEPKKVYLMLPMKRGKPAAFSTEEARRVLGAANSVLRSKPLVSVSSKFLPLFAKMCRVGSGDDYKYVSKKCDSNLYNEEEKDRERCVLPESGIELPDSRPEYLSRQISGKGWKPSLDTIVEKKIEKKVQVHEWLLDHILHVG